MATTSRDKIKCSFSDCFEYFPTQEKMKKHKKYTITHDYCYVCDIDFPDWNAATAHLAQNSGMDVFGKTNKQHKRERERGDFSGNKHNYGSAFGESKFHKYYCKHCQEAFCTDSGRQRHITIAHPIQQQVVCPGCEEIFPRASGLIMHLETDQCRKISSVEFTGNLRHKGMVSRLLRDPSLFEEINRKDFFSYLESAKDDTVAGGVSLLDAIDEDTIIWDEEEVLQPEKSAGTSHMPVKLQTWPTLAASSAAGYGVDKSGSVAAVQSAMAKFSTSNNKESRNSSVLPQSSQGQDQQTLAPWTGNSSSGLFPDAQSNPLNQDWAALAKSVKTSERSVNVLTYQFWNPASPDYDPQRFYDPIIEKYRCPMPECHAFFPTALLCQDHITTSHAISNIHCPVCFKRFTAYYHLVAHIEATGKCSVKHSNKFFQTLDEITGGFVMASIAARPDGTVDEDGDAVGYMKFEGCAPGEWERREEGVVVGRKI